MKELLCKIFGHKEMEYNPLANTDKERFYNIQIRDNFKKYCSRCKNDLTSN